MLQVRARFDAIPFGMGQCLIGCDWCSVHCPRVGYTQGMSFICALALTEMEKEWAFWLLIYIVRSLPWNFFHETAQLEVTLFMDIIENHAPIIKSNFDEGNCNSTGQWLLFRV